MIGKGHIVALVIIVDRATSFTVSKRVNSTSANVIATAMVALLTPYKVAVLTVTADNGKVEPAPFNFAQICTKLHKPFTFITHFAFRIKNNF